jgi:non-ribosomal peptide synthetase-like protein
MNSLIARKLQSSAEETRLAIVRGPSAHQFLRDELLAEIFADTVSRHPFAICLKTCGQSFTYAEVDRLASATARGLARLGVRAGDIIGLWMARSPELLMAQIAIAKTGAAWLPFDADAPVERIAVCLADAAAKGLLTSEQLFSKAKARMDGAIFTPESLTDPTDRSPIDPRSGGATPESPAYLIYTSGSTGTPKGIAISSRNICHFLRAANAVYGIKSNDVVFQGASVAFDLSMEEIWIPYLVGGALFVATPDILGEADKLPALMQREGITVLDTVPTLLSLLPSDVTSLRIIILGGEACPPSLVSRWLAPNRRLFNSYGPTEATVVATIAEVRAGAPVTIGKPIANYTCYVADEAQRLVEAGVEGELLIGGPGVALGYPGREALTREKFIANPFPSDGCDPILYRSGDAVALNIHGDIVFHGRIDDQVKVRGFRVELGEIEAKLCDHAAVAQAAVVLRHDEGLDQLVAFLVPEYAASVDRAALRADLRTVLPPYMIPGRFEIVKALPQLSSGKINRKELTLAPLSTSVAEDEQEAPQTPTEAKLLDAAKRVLPPQPIPLDADFFTELGGHSLLAARFVSVVRETPTLASLTLQDIYAWRSLRKMAALLDTNAPQFRSALDLSFTPPPLLRRFFCGLGQAITLPFILALMTAQWLGVFVSYLLLTDVDANLFQEIASLLGVYVCINIVTVALAIGGKWLIIGRMKPGRYPLWGSYYFRWWLAQRFLMLTHMKWFQGSPIIRLYLRALGASVGSDAIISDVDIGAVDLVSIGARATIGGKVNLANARVEGNELILGRIDIGDDAYVGTACVIEEDVVIAESAELRDVTAVSHDTRIGSCEIWDGSPARKVGVVSVDALPPWPTAGIGRRAVQGCLYGLLLLAIPPLGMLPIFPAFWIFDRLDSWLGMADSDHFLYLASIPIMAWPTAFVMVIVTVLFIAVIRWSVLPRVTEGTYSVFSWFYLRKWVVALATEITLEVLSSLFATVYMRNWYRLMGAKIGKDAEISTNLAGRYDLVEIGEKCFIADEVVLGDEDIRRGWMYLKRVKTGSRVFVGNDGVVPPGSDIPDGALIGIKSKPPENALMSPGDTWFGSPPIKLPVRQRFDGGGANWTYEAPKWKKFMRAVFEAVHISLPTMLFITFGTWAVEVFGQKLLDGKYGAVFWLFVAASVAISLALTTVVILIKWATMGRYEPVVKPMWSWWAMRTEAVAVMYWGMAGKVLLDHLRGTPFLPWVLRLFGTKFGKGVYMDMTDITEFDCVTVGDFAVLNALCALQTHLYEDRVMKVGKVNIGRGVTVGAGATVLYDTHVGDFARLGPWTLIMKGEDIPAHSEWVGAPAEVKRDASACALPAAA